MDNHHSITGASNDKPQTLIECSNFFNAGPLKTEPVPLSGSAVADAIAGNQNFYFDEAVHKDKANACRDFVRLSTAHDCAAIVAVPLPCHSKIGGDPRAACPHCSKSFMLAGRPLGCLLLGIRRNTDYSIREYLAKLVVLAGCIGPRLLALHATSSPTSQTSPRQGSPPRPPNVSTAMASSWYANATPPRRNSIDVGSLAGAVSWHPLTSPRTPTSLASSMLAPLPEAPPLVPDMRAVQPRTSLDWLVGGSGGGHDARMSLDSQVSAHSLAMLGSRGTSFDGRLLQPTLASASLTAADVAALPPSTAAMAQQLGLLDLVAASPEKLQLLEALQALQNAGLGGYPPNNIFGA